MGVQLNIKDEETVRLARDLATQLGKTVTETVREALEEKARARQAEIKARSEAIQALVEEIRAKMPPEVRGLSSKEIMDSIYGEDGLPEE